jgi:hypothetical protein
MVITNIVNDDDDDNDKADVDRLYVPRKQGGKGLIEL